LPTTSGTVITTGSTFGGTGPAFAVYLPTPQTVTAGVFTKVNLTTENFDTNSNFDATTNYRFTPTVAGYYQFNAGVYAGSVTRILANIKKNNSTNFFGTDCQTADTEQRSRISILLYMNGTTDYVELFALLSDGTVIGQNEENTFFNGFLARSA
jgi:hypothetical protein